MKHLLTLTALVAITACTDRLVSIDCPPNIEHYDAVRYDCGSFAPETSLRPRARPEPKEPTDVDNTPDRVGGDGPDGGGDPGDGGDTPPKLDKPGKPDKPSKPGKPKGNPGNDKPVGNAGEQPGGKPKGDGVKGASQ